MHDFINVFAYLIIATIAFVLPVIASLLSIFSRGIAKIKKQSTEEKKQIGGILRDLINKAKDFDTNQIKVSNKALKKSEKDTNSKLKLLNPRRQLKWISIPLFISIFLICCDMVLRDNKWNYTNHTLSVILLVGSVISFSIGMMALKRVTWILIETKIEIEEEEKYVQIEHSSIKTGNSPPTENEETK